MQWGENELISSDEWHISNYQFIPHIKCTSTLILGRDLDNRTDTTLYKRSFTMNKLLSCRYNMDTNRVEALFADGSAVAIDCIAILDWLLYMSFAFSSLAYKYTPFPEQYPILSNKWVSFQTGTWYPQQRKTERSRWGTPCCTYRYRMWIPAGCVLRGAPCFFYDASSFSARSIRYPTPTWV